MTQKENQCPEVDPDSYREVARRDSVQEYKLYIHARMVELVDTPDLKSCALFGRAGSSPAPGTQVGASTSQVGLNLNSSELGFLFFSRFYRENQLP